MKELEKIKEAFDEFIKKAEKFDKEKEDVKENGEKFYRVIKKGMGGLDFGFLYSKYEIERYFCFSIDTVIERGVVEPIKKPEYRDIYLYINSLAEIEEDCWVNEPEDIYRWQIGNFFNSKESAEEHLKRLTSNKQQ